MFWLPFHPVIRCLLACFSFVFNDSLVHAVSHPPIPFVNLISAVTFGIKYVPHLATHTPTQWCSKLSINSPHCLLFTIYRKSNAKQPNEISHLITKNGHLIRCTSCFHYKKCFCLYFALGQGQSLSSTNLFSQKKAKVRNYTSSDKLY